jgi:hypothetical protein
MVAKPTATPPLSNLSKATSVASRVEPTRNAQGDARYGPTFACLKEDRSEVDLGSMSRCSRTEIFAGGKYFRALRAPGLSAPTTRHAFHGFCLRASLAAFSATR